MTPPRATVGLHAAWERPQDRGPRLGFGCVGLGSAGRQHSTRSDVRLVREALELGVRTFDTADVYGNGASERVLGRALRGHRDEVMIATKGGYSFRERTSVEQAARRVASRVRRRLARPGGVGGGASSYQARDHSAGHLRAAIEGSLRRLRTDHIDLYQLHGPQHVDDALLDELVDVRVSGKVVAFGIGAESVQAAVDWLSVPDVTTVQVPFGVLDPEAAAELFPRVAARPVDVWARGVLGGGLLRLAERDPDAVAADRKAPIIERLRDLAITTGTAVDELALAYVRSFPTVSTILLGMSSSAHLRRNVSLMAAPMPSTDLVAELLQVAGARAEEPP